MKIEDIVNSLNEYIAEERINKNINVKGHFVVQKSIIPISSFKAYKMHETILWYVSNKKYKVIHMKYIDKITDNTIEKINKNNDLELCKRIFKLISNTNIFTKIVEDNYNCETD